MSILNFNGVEWRSNSKQPNFNFCPQTNTWTTKDNSIAFKIEPNNSFFKTKSFKLLPNQNEGLELPNYFTPVQKKAFEFIMTRNFSYIALEQRLGKSLPALYAAKMLQLKTLVICPPNLQENWKSEIQKWSMSDLDISIVPDTQLENLKQLNLQFGFVIVDEANRFSHDQSLRTKLLLEILEPIPRRTFLCGTPIQTRLVDLYPLVINNCGNLFDFMSFDEYALNYCGGKYIEQSFWKYGEQQTRRLLIYDKNQEQIEKWKSKIAPFILIEKFKDHFFIDEKEESVYFENHKQKKINKLETENDFKSKTPKEIWQFSEWRNEIMRAKLDQAVKFIDSLKDEHVLIFCFHIEAIQFLLRHCKGRNAAIHGKIKDRKSIERQFLDGHYNRLFCQIKTMQGIDLYRASAAVFFEVSWSPSDNEQAKARLYSRHQTKPIKIYNLILKNSFDEMIFKNVNQKTEIINEAITNQAINKGENKMFKMVDVARFEKALEELTGLKNKMEEMVSGEKMAEPKEETKPKRGRKKKEEIETEEIDEQMELGEEVEESEDFEDLFAEETEVEEVKFTHDDVREKFMEFVKRAKGDETQKKKRTEWVHKTLAKFNAKQIKDLKTSDLEAVIKSVPNK